MSASSYIGLGQVNVTVKQFQWKLVLQEVLKRNKAIRIQNKYGKAKLSDSLGSTWVF